MVRKLGLVLTTAFVISVAGLSVAPTNKPPGREGKAKVEARVNRPVLPAGVSESWWARAQEHILNDQRAVKKTPSGEHWVRAKGLKATMAGSGATVFPDAAGASPFLWGWVSIEGMALSEAKVTSAARVVTVERGPARETFENRPDGLEHVVVVNERPKGSASLRIHIPLNSGYTLAKPDSDRERIEFRDGSGTAVLEYRDLKVYDQKQRLLESTMEPEAGGILISVRDEGAAYPVTVDPVLQNAQGDDNVEDENYGWRDNASVMEEFGYAVASAGDVNGDGFPDIVVGAPGYDRPANDNMGAAFVWLGAPAGGLQLLPAWRMEGPQQGLFSSVRFGAAVAGGGDWNADGMDDILIGAPGANDGEGLVYLYLGPDGSQQPPSTSLWVVDPPTAQVGAQFGTSVAWIGDVDGDTFDDFAVGAPLFDTAANDDAGYVAVFPGAPFFAPGAPPVPFQDSVFVGPDQAGAMWGFSLAGAMNVNAAGGTGGLDMVVGAPGYNIGSDEDAGAAFVYEWDPALGFAGGFDFDAPMWDSMGRTDIQENAQFGFSVAGPGNVNGDDTGFFVPLNDILVGAPGWDVGSNLDVGAVYLFLGDEIDGVLDVEEWSANGEGQPGAQFGYSVSGAMNVNGDTSDSGLDMIDVVIGAPGYDAVFNNETYEDAGRVYVYLTVVATDMLDDDEAMAYSGGRALIEGSRLGASVAGAGDISGDGDPDVIFGLPGCPYEAPFGISDGVGTVLSASGAVVTAGPPAPFTWVDFPPMNALIGNQRFDSQYGFSIASGGDLNGDDVHDVVVGAPNAVTALGRTGAVYVYLSSGGGFSYAPSAIVLPPPDPAGYYTTDQYFGTTVACVGDVDQDGDDELAVFHRAANLVRVYSDPGGGTMTLLGTCSDGEMGSDFGRAIAGGDVDGDGYSDLIIGAPSTDTSPGAAGSNQGAIWVFPGAGFPNGAYRFTSLGTAGGSQNGARLGTSVAVGNWDGEPNMDFMAGEPMWDTNVPQFRADIGRVLIWSVVDDLDEFRPYGTQIPSMLWNYADSTTGARFGTSISTGDVDDNNNNSSVVDEIIVGAPFNNSNAGTVYVYALGGLLGTFDGESAGDRFGSQVAYVGFATAGDELGDFAVTAPGYMESSVNLGRVYVYASDISGSNWAATQDSETSGYPEMDCNGMITLSNGAFVMTQDLDQFYEVIVGWPTHTNQGVGGGGKMGIYRGGN